MKQQESAQPTECLQATARGLSPLPVAMPHLVAILGTALTLGMMGQVTWCKCGNWSLCSWDIWSSHNSQHGIAPYFFTHIPH